MADLITHACTAVLWKAGTGNRRTRTFVAGTLLPDLLARAPAMALSRLNAVFEPLPDALVYMWAPLHLPVGMLPAAVGLSLLSPPDQRRETVANLLGGMVLHLAVDLLQAHYTPGYRIFFPLSDVGVELGLIGSEDTVRFAPILVAVTVAVVLLQRRRAASSS